MLVEASSGHLVTAEYMSFRVADKLYFEEADPLINAMIEKNATRRWQ